MIEIELHEKQVKPYMFYYMTHYMDITCQITLFNVCLLLCHMTNYMKITLTITRQLHDVLHAFYMELHVSKWITKDLHIELHA
jgi:hypothetical protein